MPDDVAAAAQSSCVGSLLGRKSRAANLEVRVVLSYKAGKTSRTASPYKFTVVADKKADGAPQMRL
jgi:hypothetical protein